MKKMYIHDDWGGGSSTNKSVILHDIYSPMHLEHHETTMYIFVYKTLYIARIIVTRGWPARDCSSVTNLKLGRNTVLSSSSVIEASKLVAIKAESRS